MPRSEITTMVQRAHSMVEYVHENLSLEEFNMFLDEIAPLPEPEPETKPTKKARKKSSKSALKSSRASGMAAAINRSLGQQRQAAKDDESSALHDSECRFVINDDTGETCGATKNDPIHDMRYLSSHEFELGKSPAQPVAERSLTNGGVIASTQGIEDEKASASVAAGGLSK